MKIVSSLLLVFFSVGVANGEILKYTDNQGKTYYVNSADKIPENYKKQTQEPAKLPPISRMKGAQYEGVAPSTSDSKRQKMEIYVTSWCPHCKSLENYLMSKKVSFSKYDIERDAEAKKRYQQIGVRGVPVIKYGSTVISGFDKGQIDQLISR